MNRDRYSDDIVGIESTIDYEFEFLGKTSKFSQKKKKLQVLSIYIDDNIT
jgi:hypothetical protein